MSGEDTEHGKEYDAAQIEVLDGPAVIRKRPGMFVGSTGERGVYQLVYEAVGRAVNEFLAGRCGSVDVTLMPDGGVRVADDGPGNPFEPAEDTGGPDLETLLTTFAESEPRGRHLAAVGMVNVGLAVTNALSSRLTVEVRCEATRRVQEYVRGVEVAPPAVTGPETVGSAVAGPETVGSAVGSGTTIAFWPDAEIFTTTWCSFAVLAERFRQVAFLNRGLRISLTDERPAGGARTVSFRFPDGVRDFVATLDAEAGAGEGAGLPHQDVFGFEREDPRMAGTMEVALLWRHSREERIRSFANSAATTQGGTHVDGFRDGTAAAVTAYARERGLLAAADPDACAHQIGRGLTAVVSVKLDRPEYRGATRGLLGNTDVRACVGEAVQEHLTTWFEEQPDRATEIVDRMVRDIYEC